MKKTNGITNSEQHSEISTKHHRQPCRELRAYLSYRHPDKTLTYWHTLDNKYEVDAIIGDTEIGIEKSTASVSSSDTKGLRAFGEEYPHAKLILLSMEEHPRMVNGIEIWPVEPFLQRLWQGKIVS